MNAKARKKMLAGLAPVGALALVLLVLCALAQALPGGHAGSAAQPESTVVINEVMSRNATTLEDDFGDYSDWIELTNVGREPVSLPGWMLMSQNASSAFVFSRETIQPGQILLVFASGRAQARSGYVHHAPFKLSASGDTVSLYNASGLLADSLETPALDTDVSFARGEDGAFARCLTPTPGAPNDQIVIAAAQAAVAGTVRLNEVMASNATYQFDDGCLCDYVELYNTRALPQSLDGYSLTDD